jgi:hypothetical protein
MTEREEQIKALTPGDAHTIPISVGQDFQHYATDTVAFVPSYGGAVDMFGLSYQTAPVQQNFVVAINDGSSVQFQPGGVDTSPNLICQYSVRFLPETALSMAALLLKHLIANGTDADAVKERLTAEGVI